MPEGTFSERLSAVVAQGNMRVGDAARWFGRPHSTVNGWINRGLNPSAGPADLDEIYALLEHLESFAQRHTKMFPIPVGLSPKDRIRHIDKMRRRAVNGR